MSWIGFGNALRLAVAQLWRSRARTALTSLGVLIGVASVIIMVGLGAGATASIQEDLQSFGVNLLMVEAGTGGGPQARTPAPPLENSDVDAIAARVPGLAGVAPVVSSAATVVLGGESWDTTVTGTTASYLTVSGRSLAEGRTFTEGEARAGASVCVIGESIREALFGYRPALGSEILVGRSTCVVIGLLVPEGENTMGMDQDDVVLMPFRTVQRRLLGTNDINNIMVSVGRSEDMDAAQASLDALLRERRHITNDTTVNFTIRDTREMAATLGGITQVLTAFLAAVAGVSLLVGGIGIMNIMLVSVTERTQEIGIRMAIGALESDIRTQFLVEAGVLAGTGGVLGVIVGIGGTALGATLLGIPVVIQATTVLLAVGFSVAMGVGFGWVPARRAARLEPIDALRHT